MNKHDISQDKLAPHLTRQFMPWIAWFLCAMFTLYQMLLQASPATMLPNLMQDFGINATKIGFLSSTFFYTYLTLQIPSGMLIDRFGPRRVLTLASLICMTGCLLFGLAQHLWTAELGRLLMGFAAAPAFSGTLYIIANWFPAQRFPLVMGFTETIGMTGTFVGEIYLTTVVTHQGWRHALLSLSAVGAILSLLIWIGVRRRPAEKPFKKTEVTSTKAWDDWSRMLLALKDPQIMTVGCFAGFSFAVVIAFSSLWCLPYMQLLYNTSRRLAATLSSLTFLGIALGSPSIGWLSQFFPWRRLMHIAMVANLMLLLVVIYLPIRMPIMMLALLGVGFTSAIYVLAFSYVRLIAPSYARGTTIATINALSLLLGSLILQPLIGYLLKLHGKGTMTYTISDYRVALVVLPLCSLFALLTIPWIRKSPHFS